jgi:hypothetical protein
MSALFAADADLEMVLGLPAALYGHFHQRAHPRVSWSSLVSCLQVELNRGKKQDLTP